MVRDGNRSGNYWPDEQQELLLRVALLPRTEAIDAWRTVRTGLGLARLDPGGKRLLPLLGAALQRHGIDDPLLDIFDRAYRFTASRNRDLLDCASRLLVALQDAGVDTLVLKGAALVEKYYGDIGLRPMTDFDVLVPTAKAMPAIGVLARSGWKQKNTITPSVVRMQHAGVFVDGAGHQTDLHWHMLGECCQDGADDDFWTSSAEIDIQGARTRALSPADQLLHVCVHGSRRARTPGIRWVADSLMILRSGEVDWQRVVSQAVKRRLVLRMREMLGYLRTAMGAPVPDETLALLSTLPVSSLERLEYRVGNREYRLLGELPSYWCDYLRLVEGRRIRAVPAFPLYLQQMWELDSLGRVFSGAAARAGRRLRVALGRRAVPPRSAR